MKKNSIEYAHIYTNSKIDKEHIISVQELKKVYKENDSLVVMVDDYSFPDPTFDYDSFISWLTKEGYKPHVILRESQLIPLCDQVVKLIRDSKLKKELVGYIKTKRYPCSLFIASWYLLRLGELEHPIFPKGEYSEKLVNILAKSFKPFEEKAFEIIASTKYENVLSKITNKYIPGREIN